MLADQLDYVVGVDPHRDAHAIGIVDVWESREVFDRFSQEQIGPFSQQAGITEPPETTYRDVHNHLPHS